MAESVTSLDGFRAEVQAFCAQALPADIRRKGETGVHYDKSDIVRWQKILQQRNWFVGHWPKEHGGLGWSALQRFVFDEEVERAGTPHMPPFQPFYIGPILFTFGTQEQKDKYLPATRNSDIWWCQGYSEPGAGSDLAGLKTRAVREGEFYRVNGQKIWTSTAAWADMIFALVRTSNEDRPQKGISFLMIDMKSPGVTVRPIRSMDDLPHVNEVFFEDVMVPVENRIGEEGKGWTYSTYLLSNERLIVARPGLYKNMMARVEQMAETTFEAGRPLAEDPAFSRKLADAGIAIEVLDALFASVIANARLAGEIGPITSIMKLRGSELQQQLGQLMMEVLGRRGIPFQKEARHDGWQGPVIVPPDGAYLVGEYLIDRAISIAGGSNEIMHNILAKSVFGLRWQ
jgi:alkylation response protein AidB-like acyl-CoA dehydrogenase